MLFFHIDEISSLNKTKFGNLSHCLPWHFAIKNEFLLKQKKKNASPAGLSLKSNPLFQTRTFGQLLLFALIFMWRFNITTQIQYGSIASDRTMSITPFDTSWGNLPWASSYHSAPVRRESALCEIKLWALLQWHSFSVLLSGNQV